MTLKAWQRQIQLLLAQKFTNEEANQLSKILIQHYTGATTSDILLSGAHVTLPMSYLQDVERLLQDEPWQYIVGEAEFCGLSIKVSPAVLIPRPETEELIHIIRRVLPIGHAWHIVDICSGSGCIALAMKHLYNKAHVEGWEWSDAALEQSRANAAALGLHVNWYKKDALDLRSYHTVTPFADIIISNPPYVKYSERQEMQANVLDFEPEMALFVPDNDALVFYRAIIEGAGFMLKPTGLIFFEINEKLANEVEALLKSAGFTQVKVHTDFRGKPRFVEGSKP